ncbi:MAG: ankyrin repeat domain-containing protein [Vampirovibrionales bacterium]
MQMSSFLIFLCAVSLILGLYGCGGTNTSTEATSMVVQAQASPLPAITGNPNAVVGQDGETRLHSAAKKGDARLVEALILAGADVNKTNDYGETPLHIASYEGQAEVVKVLLAHVTNVNQADNYGRTPLNKASFNVHAEVVEVLLAHGADVNQADNYGETPLDTAKSCIVCSDADKQATLQLLRQAGGISTEATSETSMVAKKETSSTESPNAIVGERGDTRLHIAAIEGNTRLVEDLLLQGANVDSTNSFEKTPLHEASVSGHTKVVKILLAHGAKVNKTDHNGVTPLFKASIWGEPEVAKVLLAHGANIHQTDNAGSTPLHGASGFGCAKVVKVLLAHGAKVNQTDHEGRTPLDRAKECRCSDEDKLATLQVLRRAGGISKAK